MGAEADHQFGHGRGLVPVREEPEEAGTAVLHWHTNRAPGRVGSRARPAARVGGPASLRPRRAYAHHQ